MTLYAWMDKLEGLTNVLACAADGIWPSVTSRGLDYTCDAGYNVLESYYPQKHARSQLGLSLRVKHTAAVER